MQRTYFEEILGDLQNCRSHSDLEKSRYYPLIASGQKIIHDGIPKETFCTDKPAAAEVGIREEIFEGTNYKRAVIYLLSNGCEWALKDAHGCTMCGHLAKQTRREESIDSEDYLKQFEEEFDKIDFSKYPILNLYNNGSFLNDNEIPSEAREGMLKRINNNPHIKMLVLETRPEFVTEEKVSEIKGLIPGKHIEIGIGLEIKNDFYRGLCVNKGFSLRRFNLAAGIITKYLKLRTYVLLKPLFLTEREGIEHAVETIEYAFEVGATTVSLEPCTIQDHTLMKLFYDKGMYTPPWLWSIIEVVKRVRNPGKLIVGLFKFYPSPSVVPHNCAQCNEKIMEGFYQYNRRLDRGALDNLDCSCKESVDRIVNEHPTPFLNRLKPIKDVLVQLNDSLQPLTRSNNLSDFRSHHEFGVEDNYLFRDH